MFSIQGRKTQQDVKWNEMDFIELPEFEKLADLFIAELKRLHEEDANRDDKDMADEYDALSIHCSIVEFRRITDSRSSLEVFVQKVLALSALHQAKIETSMPFGIEAQVDLIKSMKVEPYGTLYRTMINFKFE